MIPSPPDNNYPAISRKDKWLLGAVFVLAGLAYREIFLWNFSSYSLPNYVGWFFNLSDTSPQFLYAFAAGLLYLRRHDIAMAFNGKAAPWSAQLFLMPGIALFIWGRYIGASDIVYMSFLLVSFGAALLLSGRCLTRQILAPFLILVLAIPFSGVLINQMVFPFQLWTAEHSAWLLNLIGIPSYWEGDMIFLAAGNKARLAESCTALGFIKWLLIFALAYVYIFPVSRLHAFLLVLSAPFIAYAVNLLRALSLVLSPGKEVLSIHLVQGIVFFMIGFALLYVVDSILLRLIAKHEVMDDERVNACRSAENARYKHRLLLTLTWMFSVLFLLSAGLPRWPDVSEYPARKISLSVDAGGWKLGGDLPENRLFLGRVRYSSHFSSYYVRGNEQVAVFIGYNDRRRRDYSLISGKNAFQGEIGLVEEQFLVEVEGVSKPVQAIIYTNNAHGRQLSYHWYEGTGSIGKEILRALLALDQSPLRRPGGAMVIRLSTDIAPIPQGRELADKRLRDFLAAIRNQR